MISREEIQAMRQRMEHPDQPLQAGLAVINSDSYCDYCRGRGKDEAACDLSDLTGVGWVVVGQEGGTYHLDCARELDWQPSEKEAAALAQYPNGPYA